jgi:hypothetical protein
MLKSFFNRITLTSGRTVNGDSRLPVVAPLLASLTVLVGISAFAPPAARADHGPTRQCTFFPIKWCHNDGGSPIQRSKADDVGWGKGIETTATLHRDGNLAVDSYGRNSNWFGGLRPRTLVVVVDEGGRAIWVSQVFESRTLCGVLDVTCASNRRETFVEAFPAAVGHHAVDVRIYHADAPNYVDLRNSVIDAIKSAGDIAEAVKAELDKLQKT